VNEERIRRDIKNILMESLDEVHLTLRGKYVPFESKECYLDLASRIADAEAQRNCCARGTAARMHYNGLLSILRQKSKKHPLRSSMISESNRGLNEAATLFSTFVQPLTDVFKTAKMAALQSLSAVWMMFRSLLAFDPEKLKALNEEHDKRVETVEKQYADVLKRTNASLTEPDASVAFMLFAPKLWSSIYAKEWTVDRIDNITYAYKSIEGKGQKEKASKEINSNKKINDSYLTFKSLFENKNFQNEDPNFIFENEKQKEQNSEELMNELIESDEFIESSKEMREAFIEGLMQSIKPTNDEISKLNGLFDPNSEFGKLLMQSESIEEVKKLIAGIEIGKQNIFDIKNLKEKLLESLTESEKQIKRMSDPKEETGGPFTDLLKAQLFKSEKGFERDEELSAEDIQKIRSVEIKKETAKEAAEKEVLKDVKKGFFTDGKNQLESIKSDISEITLNKFPFLGDEKAIETINSSDPKLGELVKDTVRNLGIK
jgi:hypothetical protein